MRATPEDLTPTARIRDAAMHLFAARGFDATSIRDIAAAAGVSSSLVVHHFKSKAQLRAATDARLISVLTDLLAEVAPGDTATFSDVAGGLAQTLSDEPDLMAYLRRMLIDGGEPAQGLFAGIIEATVAELARQEAAGVVLASADARTRAIFLVVNDLGAIVLRDLVEHAIGVDPMSPAGMQRWGAVAMDVYTRGVYAPPCTSSDTDSPGADQEGG